MAHVVIVESKLTNSFEIVRQARLLAGHRVTFATSDLGVYLRGRAVEETDLRHAARVLELSDTASPPLLAAALERLHAGDPIDAVLTLNEPHVVATAVSARGLGLPHTPVCALRATRDKHTMRQVLAEAAVPQPGFRLATTLAQATRAAADLGLPVVVKPVDGSGSVDVAIVDGDLADVAERAACILARETYGRSTRSMRRILIEEFVPGPVVSCETFSHEGRHELLGITDRTSPDHATPAEIGGCFPADVPQAAEVADVCRRALDALGLRFGAAHTELVVGPKGPVVIEVNGRLVGGMIPELMDHALGGHVYLELIDAHLGAAPAQRRRPQGVACIRTIYSERDGVLRAVVPSPALGDARVRSFTLTCSPGDPVRALRSNRERMGFVIVVDREQEDARALAETIAATTVIELEPVVIAGAA
ncbi:MAG TPA: ATP-grasp domain-containing protein [Solirubrobacteraceae bacterium]|jgi:cysteine synthase A|nr:ATP-grasp domain-containing protein [Solirubrobacteraceae bacterium]